MRTGEVYAEQGSGYGRPVAPRRPKRAALGAQSVAATAETQEALRAAYEALDAACLAHPHRGVVPVPADVMAAASAVARALSAHFAALGIETRAEGADGLERLVVLADGGSAAGRFAGRIARHLGATVELSPLTRWFHPHWEAGYDAFARVLVPSRAFAESGKPGAAELHELVHAGFRARCGQRGEPSPFFATLRAFAGQRLVREDGSELLPGYRAWFSFEEVVAYSHELGDIARGLGAWRDALVSGADPSRPSRAGVADCAAAVASVLASGGCRLAADAMLSAVTELAGDLLGACRLLRAREDGAILSWDKGSDSGSDELLPPSAGVTLRTCDDGREVVALRLLHHRRQRVLDLELSSPLAVALARRLVGGAGVGGVEAARAADELVRQHLLPSLGAMVQAASRVVAAHTQAMGSAAALALLAQSGVDAFSEEERSRLAELFARLVKDVRQIKQLAFAEARAPVVATSARSAA